MTSAFLRVSALAFAFSLLAGCGGSSGGNGGGGGGGGNPTEVTFTFAGGTPNAVATQIGSGAYTQATVESGQLTLSIPGGETNYSVAYMCPGTVAVTSGVASGERVALAEHPGWDVGPYDLCRIEFDPIGYGDRPGQRSRYSRGGIRLCWAVPAGMVRGYFVL